MLFSPTARCSSGGEFQAVLADHRSQLSELGALCDGFLDAQNAMKESHGCLRNEVHEQQRALQDIIASMRESIASLREEQEALRDCLTTRGLVNPVDLSARKSRRRATVVLQQVLEVPELAQLIGNGAGVSAARSMRGVSKALGGSVERALVELERKMPPDVYVFGGKNDSALALKTAERFSPITGEWAALPPMRTARYGCAAAALGGRLYVVGGHDGKQVLASAESFDPTSKRWEAVPPMPTARSRCAAAALRGFLYVIGGRDSRQRVTAAERFDPGTGRWEHLPPMPLAPMGCAAAALGGAVYVVGVGANREMALERFDPGTFVWQALPSVPRQRFGGAAAQVRGALYVVGGHDGDRAVSLAERLHVAPSAKLCSTSSPNRRTSTFRAGFGGGLDAVAAERAAVVQAGKPVGDTACSWQLVTPLPTSRHGCAATAAGGFLYVLGGDDGQDSRSAESLSTAERYDPIFGRWEKLPPVPTGRFGCAAASAWM